MKLNSYNPLTSGSLRPEVASAVPVGRVEETAANAEHAPVVNRNDEVHISAAGRALAARTEGADALTPERTAEIRQRVLQGAYNTLPVVDNVARRIVASGDLG